MRRLLQIGTGLLAAALAASDGPFRAQRADASAVLVDSAGDDRAPAWSPDGRRLAFESNRDGNWEIYVLESSGREATRVTRHDESDRYPAWSPDGRRLVFARLSGGRSELIVSVQDGSDERVLLADDGAGMLFPDWSPDGARIAFTRQHGEVFQLRVTGVDPGGSSATLLSASSPRDLWPRWSRDGRRLAFFSRREPHRDDDEVYVAEGNAPARRLTARQGHDFTPAWSPDGTRLVVAMMRPGEGPALGIIGLDGSLQRVFATGFAAVTEPSWHPDGRSIAFAARTAAGYAIHSKRLAPF